MNEATYQALKMAQEYHERKYQSNKEMDLQINPFPTMTEILATANEIYNWIISLNPEDSGEELEFPLEVEDLV